MEPIESETKAISNPYKRTINIFERGTLLIYKNVSLKGKRIVKMIIYYNKPHHLAASDFSSNRNARPV